MILGGILLAAIPAFAALSLADAQQRVATNSVDVQTALATVRQRDAALHVAQITGVPHLVGDYSVSPQANAANTGTVEQHFVSVGVGVSINDLFANSPAVRGAAGELLAAQRNADAAMLAARQNAAKLYFAALQAVAIERARGDAVRGAQLDRNAADLRARSGESPQLDVIRADVTLLQARADLVRAQADRADAIDALASASRVSPAQLATMTASPAPPLKFPDEDRAVERALALRPEVAALLATIDARNAGVAAARRTALPTATIQGGYQRGVDTGIPVNGPQVAAHLDLPLSSPSGAQAASAQALVDAARAQLTEERRTLTLDVTSAIRDARADDAAAAAAERGSAEALRALNAVEIGYREGASSSLDVAEARRTYDQAAVDALVAEYRRALAYAILEVIVP
jgi:outer membrane protein TolC